MLFIINSEFDPHYGALCAWPCVKTKLRLANDHFRQSYLSLLLLITLRHDVILIIISNEYCYLNTYMKSTFDISFTMLLFMLGAFRPYVIMTPHKFLSSFRFLLFFFFIIWKLPWLHGNDNVMFSCFFHGFWIQCCHCPTLDTNQG